MHHAAAKAFTLIELLVVVAIIAIIAAIAIPNFLEAQTRSKISRIHADARTLATGMEAYRIDYNHYPIPDLGDYQASFQTPEYQSMRAWVVLTTPVSYLGDAHLVDIFRRSDRSLQPPGYLSVGAGNEYANEITIQDYRLNVKFPRNVYVIISSGPDFLDDTNLSDYPFSYGLPYDPTNGTVSEGDVFRCGPAGKVPRGWKTGPPTLADLGLPVANPF